MRVRGCDSVFIEDVEIVAETGMAWLVKVGEEGEDVWVPKSQCELDTEEGLLEVPRWLAERHGWV